MCRVCDTVVAQDHDPHTHAREHNSWMGSKPGMGPCKKKPRLGPTSEVSDHIQRPPIPDMCAMRGVMLACCGCVVATQPMLGRLF